MVGAGAGARTIGLPASCAGWGALSASFGRAGSGGCRSAWATGFAEAFALLAGFCADVFPGGFLVESFFGADGRADSVDTDAVGVALGFGVSAGSAETVEAGADGAVAVGVPSGATICEGAGAAVGFARAGVKAGAADSKPKEAGFGASAPASPPAGSELIVVGAAASSCVSKFPTCESAACRLSCISGRASLEGSSVSSFCGLAGPSVATTESSRFGRFGALFMTAKLAQIAAAPASASPPPVSFQLRELGLVDF